MNHTVSAAALALLDSARADLADVSLPLELAQSAAARASVSAALAQLEDYIIPRYRSLDAPLLAVVGGSTGAGKSTLVNALIGRPVTPSGAIRPTTRQPMLLHSPGDAVWFEDQRVLPNLRRMSGDSTAVAAGPVDSLVLRSEESVPAGIALLDAPDVDSISADNRKLAVQLLAAADLWIFVTTANRYADAVPWQLLLDAASRDIMVGVVLNRVPPAAKDEVATDLQGMLADQGLGSARLFVIEESPLDEAGMLPTGAVESLRGWLHGISASAASRVDIARKTLGGAVRALAAQVETVAQEAQEQHQAATALHDDVVEAFSDAKARCLAATRDGTMLRGEVLSRWQDFVGTGDFFRAVESNVGRLRDRLGAFMRGQPKPAVKVETAIEAGLHAVIVSEAANAAERADQRWRSDPAGRQLLGQDDLSRLSADFEDRAAEQIRQWQGEVIEMIRSEGGPKRTQARWMAFGVNGLGVALMIVVFSLTAGLSGAEVGIAGGTAVVGQKILEAVFGEDAVRRLAARARESLHVRCEALLDGEAATFYQRLENATAATAAQTLRLRAQELLQLGVKE